MYYHSCYLRSSPVTIWVSEGGEAAVHEVSYQGVWSLASVSPRLILLTRTGSWPRAVLAL